MGESMISEFDAVHSLSTGKVMKVLRGELYTGGNQVRGELMHVLLDKYLKFFANMSFDAYPKDWPGSDVADKIYTAVCQLRSSKRFSGAMSEDWLRGCCGYPALIMPYRSFEDKVKIAHTTAVLVAIDDQSTRSSDSDDEKFIKDLSLFHVKAFNPETYEQLYRSRGPLHPILEELISCLLTDLSPFYYQPRHQNTLITSTLDFIEACQVENTHNGSTRGFEVTEEMVLFPDFLRRKSGISDLFLVFQLSGPELVPRKCRSSDLYADEEQFFYRHVYPVFVELTEMPSFINDFMSFYKELQNGERTNYIYMYAKRKNISPLEAMDEISTTVVNVKSRVMKMVERSGCVEVEEAVRQYFVGTLSWHVWWNKRYRLKDILGDGHQSPSL